MSVFATPFKPTTGDTIAFGEEDGYAVTLAGLRTRYSPWELPAGRRGWDVDMGRRGRVEPSVWAWDLPRSGQPETGPRVNFEA